MAAGSATATTIQEYLLTVWPEKRVIAEVLEDSPLLGLVQKKQRGGRGIYIPVRYTGQQGRSAVFSTAQGNAASSESVEFVLTQVADYAVGSITGEALDLSDKSEDALGDVLDLEMTSCTDALKRSLCVGIYGNGGGAIGRRSSVAGDVVTLTNPSDIVNFEVGMKLKAASTDGTSGSLRAGTAATVTNVNTADGKITVDAVANITAFADNDYLFVEGDFGAKMKGIAAWIPTSTPSSTAFFGVDRTVHVQRLAGHRYDGSGGPVRETIRKALVECSRLSGFPDSVFLNPTEHFRLCEELEGKVVYERSSSPSMPEVGFQGAVILSPSGKKVKVYADPSCPVGYGWALRLSDWTFYHSSKNVPTLINRDSLAVARSASADSYEWRMGYRGQLACHNPAHQCAITF